MLGNNLHHSSYQYWNFEIFLIFLKNLFVAFINYSPPAIEIVSPEIYVFFSEERL